MSLIPTTKFVQDQFGDEGHERWLQALTPQTRDLIAGGILASKWYPLDEAFVKPTLKVCELFFNGRLQAARQLGRFSADYALRGVYRFFVKIGSPGWMVKKATRILPSYYRPAQGELLEASSEMARFRICKLVEKTGIAELRIAGWLERGLEVSGAKSRTVKILKSQRKGDPFPEFEVQWK